MNFKVFNSQSPFPPPHEPPQTESQAATREPDHSDGPHNLEERFLDIIVDFRLRNATGEFPTVSSVITCKLFCVQGMECTHIHMCSVHVHLL